MSPACFFISSFKIKLHLAFTSWLNTFWASFCCSRVLPGNISRLKLALLHCRNWDCPRWVESARRCTFHIGWRTFRAWSIPSADLASSSVVAYFTTMPWRASCVPISRPISYSERGEKADKFDVHSGCPPGHFTSIPFPFIQAPVKHSLFWKQAWIINFLPVIVSQAIPIACDAFWLGFLRLAIVIELYHASTAMFIFDVSHSLFWLISLSSSTLSLISLWFSSVTAFATLFDVLCMLLLAGGGGG